MKRRSGEAAKQIQSVDFDHNSAGHGRNWPEDFARLRTNCPHAWSRNHGGFWVTTRFQDIVDIGQCKDSFSVHKDFDSQSGVSTGGIAIPPFPGSRGLPNEADPPEWSGFRHFINRRFAPRSVELQRRMARELTEAAVSRILGRERFDLIDDLTNPVPAQMMMHLFGFPLQEWPAFAEPFHKMIYTARDDPGFADTVKGLEYFYRRVDEEVEIRRQEAKPRDDLLGLLATGTINGETLDSEAIHNLAFNLMGGGVDTTTALTSNTLLYLSRHPADRQRLIDDPSLMPIAREEFIRFFSPVHAMARTATEDVDLGDWRIDKGDRVLLAYSAANRDPEAFEQPDRVILDRFPNKHIGFGAGIHRCVGSFLARMLFDEIISVVLQRMPDFRVLDDESERYTSIGTINGWVRMPAVFEAD